MKNAISIIVLILMTIPVMAQKISLMESLTEKNAGLSATSLKKFQLRQANPDYLDVQLIQFNNLPEIQKNGILQFSIPGSKETLTAIANMVTTEDDGGYVWKGDIIGKDGSARGYAIFIKKREKEFGTIEVDNDQYTIEYLGTNHSKDGQVSILIKNAPKDPRYSSCANLMESSGNPVAAAPPSCSGVIDVLFVYTNKVAAEGFDAEAIARAGIATLQLAIDESQIPQTNLSVEFVGVELLTQYEDNIAWGTSILNALGASQEVAFLRKENNADLVILLQTTPIQSSTGPIDGIAWITSTNNPNRAHGAVEAQKALNDSKLIAHELGHLLGGNHLGNGCGSSTNSAAFAFEGTQIVLDPNSGTITNTFATLMKSSLVNSIPRFSNPADNVYMGTPTGTIDCNNSKNIKATTCYIPSYSDNLPNVEDPTVPPYTAFIAGPSYVYQTSGSFTWSPLNVGCYGSSKTYSWDYSWTGFEPFSQPVTSEDLTISGVGIPNNHPTLFIRLTATCVATGQVSVRVREVKNWDAGFFGGDNIQYRAFNDQQIQDENSEVQVFPNPANEIVNIHFNMPQDGQAEVNLISINGQVHPVLNKSNVFAGPQSLTYETNQLMPGAYMIEIKTNANRVLKPLIITRY